MTKKNIILDEGLHVFGTHVIEDLNKISEENADLWAMFNGFNNAADMKVEGERMERERLLQISKKGETS